MSGYTPLYVKGNATGLVQDRENFILPDDAYPVLQNAFVWRERIKRKQAFQLLGRLRRTFTAASIGNSGASPWTFTIYSTLIPPVVPEANAEIQAGSVIITLAGPIVFTDQGDGTLTSVTPGNSGTINYRTGSVTLIHTAGVAAATITFGYYPSLPVMGIRTRELNASNSEMTVFFDTKYAYNFTASGFVEFIPGTTWSSGLSNSNSNFFWSTNYWVSSTNQKIFWVTNDSGTGGDPIRYTDGVGNGTGAWIDFAPQINATGNVLAQCLIMLPFRGRMMVFNTLEGANLATAVSYSNRIRWSAIGNPFTVVSAIVTDVNADAWRDDIRGQGGYLNIPTNEDIISVGFVRDNLVIYCESSTWQLRYTGRSIAPFQIEKVNTELGSASTYSAVQFDTSLVGIGDKGIVQCDSFKSELIDVKIPDLVMSHINNNNLGQKRVHGVRDFFQRLAYWIYPETDSGGTFPDRRLVYNYENDSWAIFTDSLTVLGTFEPLSGRTWANPTGGDPLVRVKWRDANFPWVNKPQGILTIVGGNQQGFVEYLDQQTTNDASLTINNITGNTTTPTVITSVNHNLQTNDVISIENIPGTDPFVGLNDVVFQITKLTADTFSIRLYNTTTQSFSDPQLNPPGTYIGGGQILVRDNFSIISKKFNFLEDGQNIQIGFIDILMDTTDAGAITLFVYVDYNDDAPANTPPNNKSLLPSQQPDEFFNVTIPTSESVLGGTSSTKTNQRVYCATRGNFITLEYTLSDAQMNGIEQESEVQIDMQVIWRRPAGRIGAI